MKSHQRPPVDITLILILYHYNSWKFLGFIDTDGCGSTDPGDPCLSRFSENDSNFYIYPVFIPQNIVGYFNTCNTIDNYNRF